MNWCCLTIAEGSTLSGKSGSRASTWESVNRESRSLTVWMDVRCWLQVKVSHPSCSKWFGDDVRYALACRCPSIDARESEEIDKLKRHLKRSFLRSGGATCL